MKLEEYYRGEGVDDPLLIEIPKGHYAAAFSFRQDEVSEPVVEPKIFPAANNQWKGHGWIVLASLGAFVLGFAGDRLVTRHETKSVPPSASVVDVFWKQFLQTDKQPIVAYTNALFLATENGEFIPFSGGLVAYRGALVDPAITKRLLTNRELGRKGPLYFEDDMTGVSEVPAVVAVSNAITHAGGEPTFKRGRLLTTYDLENHNVVFINVVFIGSPFVNEVLNDLPNKPKFAFTRTVPPQALWGAQIEDTQPQKRAEFVGNRALARYSCDSFRLRCDQQCCGTKAWPPHFDFRGVEYQRHRRSGAVCHIA